MRRKLTAPSDIPLVAVLTKSEKRSIKGRVEKVVSAVEERGVSFNVDSPSNRLLEGLVVLLVERLRNETANGTANVGALFEAVCVV